MNCYIILIFGGLIVVSLWLLVKALEQDEKIKEEEEEDLPEIEPFEKKE